MRCVFVVLVLAGCGRIAFEERSDASAGSACVSELSAGGAQACVLRADGTMLCKGFNFYGEVGDGTQTERFDFVPVLDDVAAIASGEFHTCAIRSDETAVCWGRNDVGQVGDGTNMTRLVPTPVQGLTGVSEIVPDQFHTCARRGGDVWCWGFNGNGVLGDGGTGDRLVPNQVVGVTQAQQIATHDRVSCALSSPQDLKCWGGGGYVGDGTLMPRPLPTPVTLPGPIAGVARGCHLHVCAWLEDGTAYCWGEGVWGQLGEGLTAQREAPVKVLLDDIVQMDLGAYHSCARTSIGDVYCWGANDLGQLTGVSGPQVETPQRIPFVAGVEDIAVGCRHTCARRGSEVTCWGYFGLDVTGTPVPPTVFPVPGC